MAKQNDESMQAMELSHTSGRLQNRCVLVRNPKRKVEICKCSNLAMQKMLLAMDIRLMANVLPGHES